ncbi:MAG TPA: metal ABC transporter permease [Thermaerobacter sp.]
MPETLAGIFQFDFMARAFAAGTIVAVIAPVIGLFLVLRRMSLIGDALAHVSLAGVAAGFLLNVYPVLVALLFALGAGMGIEYLRDRFRRHGELAVAITLATSVALAAVLFSLGGAANVDLFSYLFGSVVTVTLPDVVLVGVLGAAVLAAVVVLYWELFAVTLDEDLARASGLPVRELSVAFTGLTAAAVAVTMRVIGVLLVSSLMVLPVAASLQLARSFRGALLLGVVFAELAVWSGLLAAYYWDLPPGGTVVLAAVTLLGAVLLVKRWFPGAGPA